MKFELFVPFSLVGLALSGPARRDCGQEKCYNAVNECGMTYGGCWTECVGGVTRMPTFTAPPCSSSVNTAVSIGVDYPTQTSNAVTNVPSPANDGTAESLITPPPALDATTIQNLGKTSTCSPLWLCVDYTAICGNLTQLYGGCYDICTTPAPITSPPCSLSSSTTPSTQTTTTPTPPPGAAYTENLATDNIAPAIDDSRALVMAEIPNIAIAALAPAPALEQVPPPFAPDASELRIVTDLIDAPFSLRGGAIARIMADKVRTPITPNVPCWDRVICREVQLGIPSPVPALG